MFKIRMITLMALLTLFSGLSYATEVIDRIVAIVNDDLITLSDFNKYLVSLPRQTVEINKDQALNDLIEQMILTQEAAKLGITVTDAEIDRSIENVSSEYSETSLLKFDPDFASSATMVAFCSACCSSEASKDIRIWAISTSSACSISP